RSVPSPFSPPLTGSSRFAVPSTASPLRPDPGTASYGLRVRGRGDQDDDEDHPGRQAGDREPEAPVGHAAAADRGVVGDLLARHRAEDDPKHGEDERGHE